jgi:hypothetical protein
MHQMAGKAEEIDLRKRFMKAESFVFYLFARISTVLSTFGYRGDQ